MMGAGIGYVAAQAGIEVVLIDRDQAAADKGTRPRRGPARRRRQAQAHDAGAGRRGARPHHRHPRLRRPRRLRPGGRGGVRGPGGQGRGHPPRRGAPARRRDLRHQHLDPADQRARQGQPRARRSSSASTSSRRSTRWRWSRSSAAAQTGDRAVAKALDFVRQIRKTPIVVNDARFFYANRCIIPYINEGVRMVAEGVDAGADRERGQAARLAARAAAARRRDLDRPRREDRQGDEGRDGRRLPDEPGRRRAVPRSPTSAGSGARPRPASTPTTTRASARASGPSSRELWPPRAEQPDARPRCSTGSR